MSRKELKRVEILSRVEAGGLKLVEAAELLRVCYRQAKRLRRRYRQGGAQALQHGNAGRPSNRAKPRKFREQVLRRVRSQYGGEAGERFGPTLAAEHLASEDGLPVNAETLRRWMLAEGLGSRERRRKQHRRRRERKEHFGELLQLDGSFEAWLPGSESKQCLMNLVDDATSTTLSQLHEQETTWAAVDVLRAWIERYGIPHGLYTDWKSVYLREPTEEERLAGQAPLTQFGRMCQKLGVKIAGASSPQAKGRVERSHGTHQDRLIKKLRLGGIRTREEANRYLRQRYLPEHNRRFSRPPVAAADYHRARPSKADLDGIFRTEQGRVISPDWVVQYEGRWLQVERESRYAPAGGKVTVTEGRDGKLAIWYRSRPVKWHEIARPAPRSPAHPAVNVQPVEVRKRAQPAAKNPPWKKWKPGWLRTAVELSAARDAL